MFVSGGENVHPASIELALTSLDGIRESVVVGVPDDEFGTRPVAFVDSVVDFNPEDVESSLRELLPGHMIPVAILPLPLDVGDLKRERAELRSLAIDRLGPARSR